MRNYRKEKRNVEFAGNEGGFTVIYLKNNEMMAENNPQPKKVKPKTGFGRTNKVVE